MNWERRQITKPSMSESRTKGWEMKRLTMAHGGNELGESIWDPFGL